MGLGSWLRDHPRILESTYHATHTIFNALDPLIARIGYRRVETIIRWPEEWLKSLIFDCRMCGMCVLHSTGMTCPMTCPKTLRNGPCGGVRANGNCEVIPDMRCVWVEAYERSSDMRIYGAEIRWLQPPVNRELEERSAWITMLTGEDQNVPTGWEGVRELTVISNSNE
jgi:hypothetical protein